MAKGTKKHKSFVRKASGHISQLLLDRLMWHFCRSFTKEKHITGKKYTKKIEGINTMFRTGLRRLVGFSKKLVYHYLIMKTAIYEHNIRKTYI